MTDITPIIPGQTNLHNIWEIDFPNQSADGAYTVTVGPNIASGSTKMNQDGDNINGEPTQDQFTMQVVIGRTDITDFVKDSYSLLLQRQVTTPEYLSRNVSLMESARLTSLGNVIKTLIGSYNGQAGQPANVGEARQRMIERLFDNGGAVGEVGNLLPASTGFTLSAADRDSLALDLYLGKTSPERIIRDILATKDVTAPWFDKYFIVKSGANVDTFLTNIYADLFPGLNINPITMLPTNVLNNQRNQASTAVGRYNLVTSLVISNYNVAYYQNGYPTLPKSTTNYRNNFILLTYAKYLPGYTPTTADVNSARSLMGRSLAAKSLQGSEWVIWKIFSTQQYFSSKTQADGLPDDGLHTDRSWVEGVIADRFYRLPTGASEIDPFSQSILDGFKNQRATFVRSLVNTTDYRTIKIDEYFNLVLGRNPTTGGNTSELSTYLNILASGGTYAGVVQRLLGTPEYYNAHTNPTHSTSQRNHEWAQAVYQTLLGRAATTAEENALASKAGASGRVTASGLVVNANEYRDKIISQFFALLLGGRLPTANELLGYEAFLKSSNRWELIAVDIMANGAAAIPGHPPTPIATGLPREFWEVDN